MKRVRAELVPGQAGSYQRASTRASMAAKWRAFAASRRRMSCVLSAEQPKRERIQRCTIGAISSSAKLSSQYRNSSSGLRHRSIAAFTSAARSVIRSAGDPSSTPRAVCAPRSTRLGGIARSRSVAAAASTASCRTSRLRTCSCTSPEYRPAADASRSDCSSVLCASMHFTSPRRASPRTPARASPTIEPTSRPTSAIAAHTEARVVARCTRN
mmetsp:Transcript_3522/g.9096  ORF Transcript_3522/g.9096 Transcript_3522/m.9096 type:complete len:213 (+) Transcript_3522:656-1294(+)